MHSEGIDILILPSIRSLQTKKCVEEHNILILFLTMIANFVTGIFSICNGKQMIPGHFSKLLSIALLLVQMMCNQFVNYLVALIVHTASQIIQTIINNRLTKVSQKEFKSCCDWPNENVLFGQLLS